MSGGSWDYLFSRINEAGEKLLLSDNIYRVAFGEHMILIADAMRVIEWIDSGDIGEGEESEYILKCINI